ncbi:MAG: sporulation protein YunB [Clostridium sp.]|nr:MAG: sporulation protein YunB [Clostridium sp.]
MLEENKKNSLTKKYYDGKIDIIYEVPMSVIYDVPILVGIGPKVPFKLDILGNIKTNVTTNVMEYGINNSLVEVILNVKK